MTDRWQEQISATFGVEDRDFAQHALDRERAIALLGRMRGRWTVRRRNHRVLIDHLGTIPQAAGQRAQNEERIRALVSETRGGASLR